MQTCDPQALLRAGGMSRFQVGIIGTCVLLAGLDGFDVLVVAYTASALAEEWALSPSALGGIFSVGLAGMGVGAVANGPIADKVGRRPAVLICLFILMTGMPLAAMASSAQQFTAARFFTGLGIGGMLANLNIIAIEYSSDRRRKLSVAFMTLGYPIGASLGGVATAYLLAAFNWRAAYWFGAVVALALLPLAWRRIPESLDYLMVRRPHGTLEKVNAVLARLGYPFVDALPVQTKSENNGVRLRELLGPEHLGRIVAASVAYFCVMMTVYFLLSWTPRTLTALGFSATDGISASMLMNIGGAIGCALYGLFAGALGARRLAVFFTLGLGVTGTAFGFAPAVGSLLLMAALVVGLFLHPSITVLYALVPESLPPAIRTTGTGLAMSVGRAGAATGPALAGLLIEAGWSRPAYFAALALPMILATLSLLWIRPVHQATPTLR